LFNVELFDLIGQAETLQSKDPIKSHTTRKSKFSRFGGYKTWNPVSMGYD